MHLSIQQALLSAGIIFLPIMLLGAAVLTRLRNLLVYRTAEITQLKSELRHLHDLELAVWSGEAGTGANLDRHVTNLRSMTRILATDGAQLIAQWPKLFSQLRTLDDYLQSTASTAKRQSPEEVATHFDLFTHPYKGTYEPLEKVTREAEKRRSEAGTSKIIRIGGDALMCDDCSSLFNDASHADAPRRGAVAMTVGAGGQEPRTIGEVTITAIGEARDPRDGDNESTFLDPVTVVVSYSFTGDLTEAQAISAIESVENDSFCLHGFDPEKKTGAYILIDEDSRLTVGKVIPVHPQPALDAT